MEQNHDLQQIVINLLHHKALIDQAIVHSSLVDDSLLPLVIVQVVEESHDFVEVLCLSVGTKLFVLDLNRVDSESHYVGVIVTYDRVNSGLLIDDVQERDELHVLSLLELVVLHRDLIEDLFNPLLHSMIDYCLS